jgi:hypothetical protein
MPGGLGQFASQGFSRNDGIGLPFLAIIKSAALVVVVT